MKEEIMEAGIDEVGRGCLAGPVVSAAVILPEGFSHPIIKDSKKTVSQYLNDSEKGLTVNGFKRIALS